VLYCTDTVLHCTVTQLHISVAPQCLPCAGPDALPSTRRQGPRTWGSMCDPEAWHLLEVLKDPNRVQDSQKQGRCCQREVSRHCHCSTVALCHCVSVSLCHVVAGKRKSLTGYRTCRTRLPGPERSWYSLCHFVTVSLTHSVNMALCSVHSPLSAASRAQSQEGDTCPQAQRAPTPSPGTPARHRHTHVPHQHPVTVTGTVIGTVTGTVTGGGERGHRR